jgi:hypothetical protein
MNKTADARIPVVFGGHPGPDDACLVEDGQTRPETGTAIGFALAPPKPGHLAGCACCTPRGPAATALGRLFMARARGEAPFFHRLVIWASPAGEAAIRAALESDAVTQARYRITAPASLKTTA